MELLISKEKIALLQSILKSDDLTRCHLIEFIQLHKLGKQLFECAFVTDLTLTEINHEHKAFTYNKYTMLNMCIEGTYNGGVINLDIFEYIIEMMNNNPNDHIEIGSLYTYKRLFEERNLSALNIMLKSSRFKITSGFVYTAMNNVKDESVLLKIIKQFDIHAHTRHTIIAILITNKCDFTKIDEYLGVTDDDRYQSALSTSCDHASHIKNASIDIIINNTPWSYGIYKLFMMISYDSLARCFNAINDKIKSPTDRIFNVRSKKQPTAIKCNLIDGLFIHLLTSYKYSQKNQNIAIDIISKLISNNHVVIDQSYSDMMAYFNLHIDPMVLELMDRHASTPLVATEQNFIKSIKHIYRRRSISTFNYPTMRTACLPQKYIDKFANIVNNDTFKKFEKSDKLRDKYHIDTANYVLFINMLLFDKKVHNQQLINEIYPKIKDPRFKQYVVNLISGNSS